MSYTVKNYRRRILAIEFTSFKEMRNTFVRVQEHAEHPFFRRKIFSLNEYHEWCLQNVGQKSLASDWLGVAMETKDIQPFIDNEFSKLSIEEKALVKLVKSSRLRKKSVVIGYVKGREEDLKHELAHAFYFLSRSYQQKVNHILRTTLSKASRKAVETMLRELSYADRRLKDEAHAYIMDGLTSMRELSKSIRQMTPKMRFEVKEAKKQLTKLFNAEARLNNVYN